MAFDGNEGFTITMDIASSLTAAYRELHTPGEVTGTFFGRNILNQILSQHGNMGIRFYFAMQAGSPTLVAVGADVMGNDQTAGLIAEFSSPCPPHCSMANPLNC